MMAHPLALQLRNLQSLVEIGVDKNTTVVFPAPLMSTIGELGAFLARETAAAQETLVSTGSLAPISLSTTPPGARRVRPAARRRRCGDARRGDDMTILAASPAAGPTDSRPARLNLRPKVKTFGVRGRSDGAWWPRTTNLQGELQALDVGVRTLTGSRIAHISYTLSAWDPAPTKAWSTLGMTKFGWFTDPAHAAFLDLTLSDYSRLVLTVIAPDTEPSQAHLELGKGSAAA